MKIKKINKKRKFKKVAEGNSIMYGQDVQICMACKGRKSNKAND